MISHIEHPEDATKKTIELINEFSKAARYKINIQKTVAFLYTNNELSKEELRKQSHLQKIKYLGTNLTKEVNELYSESHKTLMKENEDDTNNWKDIPSSWIGRISPYYPKKIYNSKQSLSKFHGIFHKK